ncbi:MAG: carboxypeptidase-like regulatory domain-containing protein, partial [Verrucomicrobia bacterium]|nr:carboxypeptidase-like regulatory domain-containing protein [Verrucomicrobiota bacterium]
MNSIPVHRPLRGFAAGALSLFFALALLCATSLRAQTTATGAVEGRVFNAATGNALVNAQVSVEGSGRSVVTDEGGTYRLAGIPAGAVKVTVSYVGMQPQSATVNVTPGGVVQRE